MMIKHDLKNKKTKKPGRKNGENNATKAVKSASDDAAQKKRLSIIIVLAYSVINGGLALLISDQPTMLHYFLSIPFIVCGVAWCHADSRQRGESIGPVMKIVLIFIFTIGFPIYALKTRGLAGILNIFCAILLVIAAGTISIASQLLIISACLFWGI